MWVGVVGSRDYPDLSLVREVVESLPIGSTVVSGGARGVDSTAEFAARRRGLPVVVHHAKWRRPDGSTDSGAGFARNQLIVNDIETMYAFQHNKSTGTQDTINRAIRKGIPVVLYESDGE